MPLKYWDEAFLAATFLINRTPSKVINFLTPLELLFHVKLNYSSLRIFGCSCWPHPRLFNPRKLEFRSKECVFLGYSNIHKGFKCLDLSTGHVYISRDVILMKMCSPSPNVGPRLREEILLLPPSLINHSHGGEIVNDHMTNISSATDACVNPQPGQEQTAEN
jgi:hypothetical protein